MLVDYPAIIQNVCIKLLIVIIIHIDSAKNVYNILIKLTKIATL
jgi:hypothetical protein